MIKHKNFGIKSLQQLVLPILLDLHVKAASGLNIREVKTNKIASKVPDFLGYVFSQF